MKLNALSEVEQIEGAAYAPPPPSPMKIARAKEPPDALLPLAVMPGSNSAQLPLAESGPA